MTNEQLSKIETAMDRAYELCALRHAELHEQLRQAKREENTAGCEAYSMAMITLRDVGRVLQGMDPTEDDTNPFSDDDDF